MKKDLFNEIQGIIVLAIGLILLASLISFVPDDLPWYSSQPYIPVKNLVGVVGAYAAGALFFAFGYSAYCLVIFLFFWSWNKFSQQELDFTFSKVFIAFVLFCVISALLSMAGDGMSVARFERGGMIGFITSDYLVRYLSPTGAYIILLTLGAMTLVLTGEFLVSPLLFKLMDGCRSVLFCCRDGAYAWLEKRKAQKLTKPPQPRFKINPSLNEKPKKVPRRDPEEGYGEEDECEAAQEDPEFCEEMSGRAKPRIRIAKTKEPQGAEAPEPPKIVGEYIIPSLDLLASPPQVSTTRLQSDLEEGARTLENTLSDFNVNARVADIERGPVITRYELEPAPGVKIQRITTLSDDIALAMRAAAVRIVAPIPGKNRVGIEVPNSSTAAVFLKEVLQGSNFQKSKSKLMLAIGKDISGHPIVADLGDMPHLLIAGTTGAGKTVCVNSLIMSVLFNATPDEVKFLMVDPKMVELTQYNDIPHMLCPAVTDHKKVSPALNWVVGEMENRYQLLSKTGVRNIKAYHARGLSLPYIIIIIDELADLMQVSAKTVESAITRLAQLSRAVGIHLILATQRPSVDVITGVIKANFPARISFKVASKVDSRTVLDMNGAETLLGKGDMLFMKPGDAKPTRGQCSFVADEEVHSVINFIKEQQSPTYDDTILTSQKASGEAGEGNKDELYDEAVRLVIETNQASVSILQRRMRLGYTRAARLIDMMEQNGLVGPYCGSKPRDILVDREEWLMEHLNQNGSEA